MSTITERAEWVESEFKKYKEMFEIPFEKEFMVEAMLELQHQYYNTSDSHIKTKSDILHTISKLQNELNLKRKKNEGKPIEILIVSNSKIESRNNLELFADIIGRNNINSLFSSESGGHIARENYKLKFIHKDIDFRGFRCDEYLNLTGDNSFSKELNKLRK